MLKKIFIFIFILSTLSTFTQNKKGNNWIIDFNENVNKPFTVTESNNIIEAFGEESFTRIKKNTVLEKNIKDILRNRVKVLIKEFQANENIPKLSSISEINFPTRFTKQEFNPLVYDFDFNDKKNQIFRVDKTDYIIIIKPRKLK
tara:strand:+ start:2615 stop:3049 length:435 start_codon:yes stop_codon:yes gene_type:complete